MIVKSGEGEVLVVGAGVIGLTSALCLAEAGLRVAIRTAAAPQQTTSRSAGAMWASSFAEPTPDVSHWASQSLQQFRALAEVPSSGVRIVGGTLASRFSAEPPPAASFPGVQISCSDRLPNGFQGAFSVELPLIDMPRYLDYLGERLAGVGVSIEVRSIGSLLDAAGQGQMIVNCTGIGARELVRDPELRPVRGEHLVVDNPGVEHFFVKEPRGEE